MERLRIGDLLPIQPSLQDSKEFFSTNVWGYERMFQYLKDHYDLELYSNRVLIGACGYGADVLGIGRVYPEAHITAVSLENFPEADVTDELEGRLTVVEAEALSYIDHSVKQGETFDLIAFCTAPIDGLDDPSNARKLHALTVKYGYIFNHIGGGGAVLPMEDMDRMFWRIDPPHRRPEIYNSLLWIKQ